MNEIGSSESVADRVRSLKRDIMDLLPERLMIMTIMDTMGRRLREVYGREVAANTIAFEVLIGSSPSRSTVSDFEGPDSVVRQLEEIKSALVQGKGAVVAQHLRDRYTELFDESEPMPEEPDDKEKLRQSALYFKIQFELFYAGLESKDKATQEQLYRRIAVFADRVYVRYRSHAHKVVAFQCLKMSPVRVGEYYHSEDAQWMDFPSTEYSIRQFLIDLAQEYQIELL